MIVCSIYVITISKKLSFFANMATFLAIFGRKTHKNLSPFRKLKKKWIWLLYPFRGCKSLAFTRSRGCKSRRFLFLFGNFLPLNGLLIVSTINQSLNHHWLLINYYIFANVFSLDYEEKIIFIPPPFFFIISVIFCQFGYFLAIFGKKKPPNSCRIFAFQLLVGFKKLPPSLL